MEGEASFGTGITCGSRNSQTDLLALKRSAAMRKHSLFKNLLGAGFLCVLACSSTAAVTTVALGVTPPSTDEAKQIAEALLPLSEAALARREGLQVLERLEASRLVEELALAQSQDAREQAAPKLGQVSAADLVVSIKLSEVTEGEAEQFAVVRVTDGRTSIIRATIAVPVTLATIEDTVDEIASFVTQNTIDSRPPTHTVAVLPFDSVENFGRIHPLERGLRDLLALELRKSSDLRVMQRSSMGQLLAELALARAGLTKGSNGPQEAQTRQSAYVIRGVVDEQIDGTSSTVLIEADLVDAATNETMHKLNA